MNKKEIPSPFNNYDAFTCSCFAYSYYICIMSFNVVLLIITEMLWMWYCSERVKK